MREPSQSVLSVGSPNCEDRAPVSVPVSRRQFVGFWAIQELHFPSVLAEIRAHAVAPEPIVAGSVVNSAGRDDRDGYTLLDGGIAEVPIIGRMTKYQSWVSDLPNGTIGVRNAVRAAAENRQVAAIVLRIDSPGGTVSGTDDLAKDVAEAATVKPVLAYIEDLAASAAYYVASQATRIAANSSALVGSIGTYGVLRDWSELFEKEGIRTLVIRAGKYKGVGVMGAKVTPDEIEDLQRVVDQLNESFLAAIQRGRGFSAERATELADGRVHRAPYAAELGLVDDVVTYDVALGALLSRVNAGTFRADGGPQPQTEAIPMTTNVPGAPTQQTVPSGANAGEGAQAAAPATAAPDTQASPATPLELKERFPKSDAQWREDCQLAGATLEQAGDRWRAELEKVNEAQAVKIAGLEASTAARSAADVPGNDLEGDSSGTASVESGDATARWDAAVGKLVKGGMETSAACRQVAIDQPELRAEMVAAHNTAHPEVARGRE